MRRIMLAICGLIAVVGTSVHYSSGQHLKQSDKYIRDRVLMLTNKSIECSAIEVKAPSGKVYTLSAAHCAEMLQDGVLNAQAEDGTIKVLKMIDIDYKHDLMLLEAFDSNSIDIANDTYKHQKVHTLTHGHGMPTYRTDGELLETNLITITSDVFTEEQMNKCTSLGRQLVMTFDGFGCMYKINLMMSTSAVLPGSSGGAVLDSEGHLAGIVSATDGYFSAFVPLKDVQNFLKGR